MKKYFEIAKINFLNSFAYFGEFFFHAIFILLILFIFTNMWKAVYSGKELIEGFTLSMMIWYLLMAESIVTSSPGFVKEVNTEVQNGEIAYKLNKPYNYILYHFAKSFSRRIINFTVTFILGAVLIYFLIGGFDFKIYSLFFLVLILFLAMTLDFFISMSIALLSFWLEDSNSLRWIYDKLLFTIGGMLVPLEIFPTWLAKIAGVLPFSFIAYSPAKLFVRFSFVDFFNVFAIQISYIIIFGCITWIIYKRGVRRLNVNGG